MIESYLKNCRNCVLLRKDGSREKREIKSIPVPKSIGEQIYVDEICRTDRTGKELKILFATEGLSRYAVAQIYKSPFTSDKFISFMAMARSVLAPLKRKSVRIICRCDGASQHASKKTAEALKQMGIDIEIYESSTFSKNKIPEHDARIGVFSRHLTVILNNPTVTREQAVMNAVIEYNQSLTNLNWSPAEIFTGRKIGSQDLTNLELSELYKRIENIRDKGRKATEKFREKKKLKKKLTLIPWRNEVLNDPNVLRALREKGQIFRIGDTVKLNLHYGKNDLDRLFVVKSINWAERSFTAQKLNRPKGKVHNLSFDVIAEVLSDTIRRVSESELHRKKAVAAFFRLYDFEEPEIDEQMTISEYERVNDLTRGPPAKVEDSGLDIPSVMPPSVQPASVQPPSVKPINVTQVQSPNWVPESELTDVSEGTEDSHEGYVNVYLDHSGEISEMHTEDLSDLLVGTEAREIRLKDLSSNSEDPFKTCVESQEVTPEPTHLVYTTDSVETPVMRQARSEAVAEALAEKRQELNKVYSDIVEWKNKSLRALRESGSRLAPDESGQTGRDDTFKDLDVSFDPNLQVKPDNSSTPVAAQKYKTKITKTRDKDSPLLRRSHGAGIITVQNQTPESTSDLKKIFQDLLAKRDSSRASHTQQAPTGAPSGSGRQPSGTSSSGSTGKTSGSTTRKPRLKSRQKWGEVAVRKSSRIAAKQTSEQNTGNSPN